VRVVIVARDEISPVEVFALVLEHGVTAIIDLHQQPLSTVPPVLRHIYQHPFPRMAEQFLTRFAQHWPCGSRCQPQRAAQCDCQYVLLLLATDGHGAEARELMRRVKPYAIVSEAGEVSRATA
jgi:hypothetical protein